MATLSAKLHLGTSGWSYRDWLGLFYPHGTRPAEYLRSYARRFHTVEIDSTFYRIPAEKSVRRWAESTPGEFLFCPKFPRIITHDKRLVDCGKELSHFLRRMALLGPKLGPLVLQFDYTFTPDLLPRLQAFLSQLPGGFRYAVEIRNRKWHKVEPFFDLLEKHRCSLVLQDLYYMPPFFRFTAPFTYIRLLGNRRQIPEDFSRVRVERAQELDDWARCVVEILSEGLEVFAYSNNRYQGHAPETVRTLAALVDRLLREKGAWMV